MFKKLHNKIIFASMFFLLAVGLILIVIFSNNEEKQYNEEEVLGFNQDLMVYMKDGLKNSIIRQIYEEDIKVVYEITNAKYIEIDYIDFDFNDDGYSDKFVILRSPLHSGSAGDAVDILINNKNGSYTDASGYVLRIYNQPDQYDQPTLWISEEMTNGYHNIHILLFDYEKTIVLKFDGEKYVIQEEIWLQQRGLCIES